METARESRIRIGDVELFYREAGSGPPLLLIHGIGCDADSFDSIVAPLAEHWRVIAYDRHGCSRSVGEPYAAKGYFARHAADAAALLRALDIFQTRFLGMIGRRRAGVAAFFRRALGRVDGTTAYDALPEATRDALLANADAFFAELKAGTGEELTSERLRTIRCPVTDIVGDRSAPFFVAASERLAKTLPQMNVVHAPEGNHLMLFAQPAAFVRLVERALA